MVDEVNASKNLKEAADTISNAPAALQLRSVYPYHMAHMKKGVHQSFSDIFRHLATLQLKRIQQLCSLFLLT